MCTLVATPQAKAGHAIQRGSQWNRLLHTTPELLWILPAKSRHLPLPGASSEQSCPLPSNTPGPGHMRASRWHLATIRSSRSRSPRLQARDQSAAATYFMLAASPGAAASAHPIQAWKQHDYWGACSPLFHRPGCPSTSATTPTLRGDRLPPRRPIPLGCGAKAAMLNTKHTLTAKPELRLPQPHRHFPPWSPSGTLLISDSWTQLRGEDAPCSGCLGSSPLTPQATAQSCLCAQTSVTQQSFSLCNIPPTPFPFPIASHLSA